MHCKTKKQVPGEGAPSILPSLFIASLFKSSFFCSNTIDHGMLLGKLKGLGIGDMMLQ